MVREAEWEDEVEEEAAEEGVVDAVAVEVLAAEEVEEEVLGEEVEVSEAAVIEAEEEVSGEEVEVLEEAAATEAEEEVSVEVAEAATEAGEEVLGEAEAEAPDPRFSAKSKNSLKISPHCADCFCFVVLHFCAMSIKMCFLFKLTNSALFLLIAMNSFSSPRFRRHDFLNDSLDSNLYLL